MADWGLQKIVAQNAGKVNGCTKFATGNCNVHRLVTEKGGISMWSISKGGIFPEIPNKTAVCECFFGSYRHCAGFPPRL